MLTSSQVTAIRRRLKMNKARFAEAVGVGRSTVTLWENGQRNVSGLAERSICQVLAEATGKAQRRVPVAAKR